MKITLAVVAALVTAVSATPIRVITLTGAPVDNLHAFDAVPAAEGSAPLVTSEEHHRPCHKGQMAKGQGSPSFFPGPIGALLSRLGLTRDSHPHHHHWHKIDSAVTEGHTLFDALREHVHASDSSREEAKHAFEMFKDEIEGKIIPLMEGGMVKILPVVNEDGFASPSEVLENQEEHKHHHHEEHEGKKMHVYSENHHHGHHRYHKAHSFGGRLHRALNNLSSVESLGLAFVLGAGLGSILHFFFMIVLLSLRRFRGGRSGMTCAQRRQARKEARKARKEARNGAVRLEGEDELVKDEKAVEVHGEMLPSYEEGEGDRLLVEQKP